MVARTIVDAESIATAAEHHRPSRLIGSLRAALAMAAFRYLRPDLIIFDEFQKFRELLIDPPPKPGSPTVPPDPLIRALDVRNSMRRQVGELLREQLGVSVRKSGGQRPLWKLLAALEHRRAGTLQSAGLPSWPELRDHWLGAAEGQKDVMREILDQWHQFAVTGLDSVTQSEVAALAEFALSGPGVVLGRALYRFDRTCITNLRYGNLLAASWNGLRPYLNRSLFHAALTRRGQTYTKVTASRRWTRTIGLVPFCMGQWERVSPSVLLLTHEGESCCSFASRLFD